MLEQFVKLRAERQAFLVKAFKISLQEFIGNPDVVKVTVGQQQAFVELRRFAFARVQQPAVVFQRQTHRKKQQRTANRRAIGQFAAHNRIAHVQILRAAFLFDERGRAGHAAQFFGGFIHFVVAAVQRVAERNPGFSGHELLDCLKRGAAIQKIQFVQIHELLGGQREQQQRFIGRSEVGEAFLVGFEKFPHGSGQGCRNQGRQRPPI